MMRFNTFRNERGRGVLSRFGASEGGVTIVELLIAMTVFAVVVSGVAVGMGSALGLTRNNRNRSVAANLAAKEMDVVRSIKFENLPLTTQVREETVDQVTYTVTRSTSWVTKDGTSGVCSPPAGTALAFLKVVVSITWPAMNGVSPVKSETILAPPIGSYDSDTGHLAVKLRDRDGAPLSNQNVTVTGPGGTFQQQTVDGCAFFIGLTPGTFVVSLNTANYVDGQGIQNPSQSIAVTAGSITSAEFDYDAQATITLNLVGLENYKVPKGLGARVANTSLTLGNRAFGEAGSSTCSAPPTTVTSNADAMVSAAYSSTALGSSAPTYFGTYAYSGADSRSVVMFNLPGVPSGCALDSATLRLYVNSPVIGRSVDVYQANGSWSESSVTWNNKPGLTGSPATMPMPSSEGWVSWGVTTIAQALYVGTNNGFVIKDSSEGGSSGAWNGMHPRELANDPELVLTWTDAPPCADSYSLTAVEDARVRQDSSGSNYGNESTFRVRTESSNRNQRSYVRFNLPSPGAGCILTSATLNLYAESVSGLRTVQAYRANGAWSESSVTWSNQPGFTGTPSTYVASSTGWHAWDALELVQAMYSGTNNGFLLKDAFEGSSTSREQRYRSSENGTTSTRPRLDLVFVGDETLPTFQTVSATPLFPYANGYQAWGGQCLDADPEGVNPSGGQPYYPGAQRSPALASDPGQTTVATVQMKSVDISVIVPSGTPVADASVRAYHDPDDGCPQGVALNLGKTDSAGQVKVALPFGTWRIEVNGKTPSNQWPVEVLSPLTADPHAISISVTS